MVCGMTQPLARDTGPETCPVALNGADIVLAAPGALWWAEESLLVVSDLHLEKGSSYAARGQMLPPYDTGATLGAVEAFADTFRPERIISLGDSFHDGAAEARLGPHDVARIRALTGAHDWLWVEGNHDPDPPASLGGRASREARIGQLVFRHEPTGEPGEVSGHLHPCVRVGGRGRSLRRRCFVTDGRCLVMPALGALTGGLSIFHAAFSTVFPGRFQAFAIGTNTVHAIDPARALPEARRVAGAGWRM